MGVQAISIKVLVCQAFRLPDCFPAFPEGPVGRRVSSPFPELRVGTGLTPARHRLQSSPGAGRLPGEATGSRTRPLPDDRIRIGLLRQTGTKGDGIPKTSVERITEFLHRAILLSPSYPLSSSLGHPWIRQAYVRSRRSCPRRLRASRP